MTKNILKCSGWGWMAVLAVPLLSAEPEGPAAGAGRDISTLDPAKQSIKMARPGVFSIGPVEFSREAGTVSFPAEVNMNTGPMEYLLVTDYGKRHESVLRTQVEPFQIHLAMLLIGAPGPSATNVVKPPPGVTVQSAQGQVERPSANRLPGKPISIQVAWEKNGRKTERKAEELVANIQTGKPLLKPDWVYNGSFIAQNQFASQVTGSIVSLITDPAAIVNSESEGHDNDKIWTVHTNSIPAVGTPVTVTFKLSNRAKP